MRTQRRVFEKLSETTKVELASERIELASLNDRAKSIVDGNKAVKSFIDKAYTEVRQVIRKIDDVKSEYKEANFKMQDAFSEYEDSEKLTLKLMTEISKTAKELGVNEKSIPAYSNLSKSINVMQKSFNDLAKFEVDMDSLQKILK
jgi:hypothetical protein